jgi:riboflavin synthase
VFTGLVEEVGTVESAAAARVRIRARRVLEGAVVGDSIAVDGCCLTLVALGGGAGEEGWWEADLSDETLARTTLGTLAPGQPVNLERPLRLADRLGGHLVQGHVDAVGQVLAPAPALAVRLPAALARYVVEKGSIAVDGVSLTVVEATDDSFAVAVVPHTAAATTLGTKGLGAGVNLEVDLVAKYVERLVATR